MIEVLQLKCCSITHKRLWHGGYDLCYFYNDSGFVRTCDYKDIGKENLHDNRPSASFLGSSRLPLTTTILLPFSTILHLWRFSTCCTSSQCSKYVSKCDIFIGYTILQRWYLEKILVVRTFTIFLDSKKIVHSILKWIWCRVCTVCTLDMYLYLMVTQIIYHT